MPRKDGTASRSGPSGPRGARHPKRSPDGPGRTSKLNEDVIGTLEQFFAGGAGRAEACAAAGITVQTFLGWLVRAKLGHGGTYRELQRRVYAAEARHRAALAAVVRASAVDRQATYDAQGRQLLPGKRSDWRAAAAALDRLDRVGLLAREDAEALGEHVGDAPRARGGQPVDGPTILDAEEISLDADDAAVLEARVRRYRKQIGAAEADGDHAAVASLTRRVERAEDALRAARREARGPADADEGDPANLPEAALREEIRIAAEQMPEDHLALVVSVYLERHRLRLVRDEAAVATIGGGAP